MFLSLLKRLLKPTDRPFLSAFISTAVSFLLCVSPFLLMIVGDMAMYLIHKLLSLLPHFEFAWLNEFIERLLSGITWIRKNISLVVMPAMIILIGLIYAHYYLRRAYLMTIGTIYIFKRATESLLTLHFAAWTVKQLISNETLYFLDHLLTDLNLQGFGSGKMVITTLILWYALKLAFIWQLRIIRKEKSATGEFAILEQVRLTLLDWVEKSQSNTQKKTQAKEVKG